LDKVRRLHTGVFRIIFKPCFPEFTDAIAEDWGGKPFVDMIAGWKHVLSSYPQVGIGYPELQVEPKATRFRSTPTARLPQAPAGEGTFPSSIIKKIVEPDF
jgi:hypothetical protein